MNIAAILPKVLHLIARSLGGGIVLLLLLVFSVSCKREVQEIVLTDTAEVKRIEANTESEIRDAKAAKEFIKLKIEEEKRLAARDSLLAAESSEKAAKAFENAAIAKQMEQEAKQAREQLAREQDLAEQKKSLEKEVSAIAEASNTISVFVADLRSRQGRLQLKQKSLPNEIKQSREDLAYMRDFLSSCRQVVVTNVTYFGTENAKVFDVKTVTRKPDEFVNAIKANKKLTSLLARYNNEAFAFELDKVVEDLAYENKRLSTSWQMLNKGKTAYNSKLAKADTGSHTTTLGIEASLDKVNSRIQRLEVRLTSLRKGFKELSSGEEMQQAAEELGRNGEYPTGLYAEKVRLKRMLEMARNTEEQSSAASSGIASSFDLHEKGMRDEYEANVRRAFDNVERTVLQVVTFKKEALEKEQENVQSDLAAIQLILTAHANGQIGQNDMLNLHSKVTKSVSESLSSAASQILK